jgi:hypothetical protein
MITRAHVYEIKKRSPEGKAKGKRRIRNSESLIMIVAEWLAPFSLPFYPFPLPFSFCLRRKALA